MAGPLSLGIRRQGSPILHKIAGRAIIDLQRIPIVTGVPMGLTKAYDEVVDLIASGATPREVAEFRASDSTRQRVAVLVGREKFGDLTAAEAAELDRYLTLEHLMRLAKARARRIDRDE